MPLALDQAWRAGLVAARLGPPHRQDPPRTGIPKTAASTPSSSSISARKSGRAFVSCRCRHRRDRRRTGRPSPDRAQLASAPATVSTVIIGARTPATQAEPGAVGWSLTPQQIAKLDVASQLPLAYPYWHQRQFEERIPVRIAAIFTRSPKTP